jgi:hypothetical protein
MVRTIHPPASSDKQKEAQDKLARAIAAIVGLPTHTTRHSQLFLDRIQKYQRLSVLHRFKRWIPGTRDFKRRRQQAFLTATSNRAVLFGGLKSLTVEQKKSLFRKFLKVQHRLVPLELIEGDVHAHFKGVTGIFGASILLGAAPLAVWHWHHFNLYRPMAFLTYFALVTVVMNIATASIRLVTSLTMSPVALKFLTFAILFSWPGMIFVVAERTLAYLSRPASTTNSSLQYGILGAIYAVTLLWGMIFVGVAVIVGALQILSSRKYRLHPEAVVADRLFRVLFELDQNKSRDLGSHEVKNSLIDLIESTAVAIETGMVKGSRTADPLTSVWFSNRMGQIAASVRDLKKWVLTPKEDTRPIFKEDLQRYLSKLLKAVGMRCHSSRTPL